jgi:NDP-sugar pyrophosphorylase family protein
MEGMIFAAGLGTRLRPLTDRKPKALAEVGGKTLLEGVLGRMREAGIGRIVVNVHHFAEQVEEFLQREGWLADGVVVSDEREELLDTGGGLLKARELFTPGEAVMVHNVDIYTEMDLRALAKTHGEGFATLAVRGAASGRGLRFGADGRLKGWENSMTGERKVVGDGFEEAGRYGFCGVQVVSSEFLSGMKGRGRFSIIDEYLVQAAEHEVRMFFYGGRFLDLGTVEAVREAEGWMTQGV